MKYRLLYIFISIILFSCGRDDRNYRSLRLCFTGDILLDRGVREFVDHHGLSSLFNPLTDSIFKQSDLVIGNLECPATKIHSPLHKKYIFRTEPEWLDTLRVHGFTHLNMANNHSMDQDRKGLRDTELNIKRAQIIPVGYGSSEDQACRPFLLASRPRKIYLLSSVQVKSENWTYLPEKDCVCEAQVSDLVEKIRKLREKDGKAVIIVQLHWGREHSTKPEIFQVQQAHQLIEAGADCIVGHHPHTIQPVEWYHSKPVFNSLGNFIFDQKNPINRIGMVLQIEVSKESVHYREIYVMTNPSISANSKIVLP